MKNRNCPNCGAVYELDKYKCPYCDTLYLDLGCLDLSENTPVFIKYRVPFDKKTNMMSLFGNEHAYITQCAIPKLENITVSYDTDDYYDLCGNLLSKFYTRQNAETNLKFMAIPFGEEKSLFRITMEE